MTTEYAKKYFSSGRKYEEQKGYLRLFPAQVKEWYFKNYQPRLEAALRNYGYFVPDPKGRKILEIGFGNGGFMRYCGRENIVGIDIWKESIAKLKREGFDARFHDAAKPLPFRDGQFDTVYTEQVIEHVYDGVHFAKEMRRVLCKGGKAVIRTVDFKRAAAWFYTDYTHVHPYTKESLYRLLEDCGFEVKEVSHGISPNSFLMRRVANAAIFLPKFLQDIYFYGICRHFSYELFAIAVKR